MAKNIRKTPVVKVVVTGRRRADLLAKLCIKRDLKPAGGFFLYGTGRFEGCFTKRDVGRIEAFIARL